MGIHRIITTNPKAFVCHEENLIRAMAIANALKPLFPTYDFVVQSDQPIFELPDANHFILDAVKSTAFQGKIDKIPAVTQHSIERSQEPSCKKCGSLDVRKDALAAWDKDSQQWELLSTHDQEYCGKCEDETHLVWKTCDYTAPKYTVSVMVEVGTEYVVHIQAGDVDAASDAAIDKVLADGNMEMSQVENASVTLILEGWPTVLFKD